MATKSVYSTKGKDILINGKVVSSAPTPEAAVTMAQKSAKKSGGTYQETTATPTAAPAPAPAPTQPSSGGSSASKTGTTTVYKKGSSTQILNADLNTYLKNGWSQTPPSSSPAPATTPAASPAPAAASTAPAGATYVSNPAELSKLTESQIWRDPSNGRIYKLAAPSTPNLTPQQTAPAGTAPTAPAAGSSGLNTVGLIEAYARKQAGTASSTDLANLDYAMNKGWTPPAASGSSTSPASPSAPTQTGGAQTDANGNQVIPGLNTSGLNEAYARKVAGTANETDLKNLAYAESKGWKPPSSAASTPVNDAQTANDIINSEQDADIAARTESDEPTVRSSVDDIMGYLRDQLQPNDVEKPEAPNFEKSLTDLRTEYAVSPLETSLNDLQKEQADLLARRQARINAERGKTVAMNVIEGRVSEVERQENERLTQIANDIQNVTNQLNTKYSIISAIMETKELDYNTAVQSYDAQMQENITLFNAAQNIQENLKTEAQRAIDNARASAQIMVNGYASSGLSFSELSPAQQTTLRQLAVQAGFDASFYENILSVSQEVQKDILTHVISDDKAYATIIYKDGTTATIPTGQPRTSNTPVSGDKSTTSAEEKEYQSFLSDAAKLVEKLDSGEISWATAWDQLHIKYENASPQLIDEKLGGGKAYTDAEGRTVNTQGQEVDVNEQGYYGRGTQTKTK